jgi:hypothetical protein
MLMSSSTYDFDRYIFIHLFSTQDQHTSDIYDMASTWKEVRTKLARRPSLWDSLAVALIIFGVFSMIFWPVMYLRDDNPYPSYSRLTYHLRDTYSGPHFFDSFDFFDHADPTKGFVRYVSEVTATQPAHNLTYASESSAILRVDTTADGYDATTGRWSVRISSKQRYDSGLFVFDVLHSPVGCATWPALWSSDDNNWPDNGKLKQQRIATIHDS